MLVGAWTTSIHWRLEDICSHSDDHFWVFTTPLLMRLRSGGISTPTDSFPTVARVDIPNMINSEEVEVFTLHHRFCVYASDRLVCWATDEPCLAIARL